MTVQNEQNQENQPTVFVEAAEAKSRLESVLNGSNLFQAVEITFERDFLHDWWLHIRLTGTAAVLSLDLTADRNAQVFPDGTVMTSFGSGTQTSGTPHYTLWTVMDCEYLWHGASFDEFENELSMQIAS